MVWLPLWSVCTTRKAFGDEDWLRIYYLLSVGKVLKAYGYPYAFPRHNIKRINLIQLTCLSCQSFASYSGLNSNLPWAKQSLSHPSKKKTSGHHPGDCLFTDPDKSEAVATVEFRLLLILRTDQPLLKSQSTELRNALKICSPLRPTQQRIKRFSFQYCYIHLFVLCLGYCLA